MKFRSLLTSAITTVSLSVAAHATVVGYVNNLSGNSMDFAAAAGSVTTYTFDTLSSDLLNPNAYAGFTFSGSIGQVVFGSGPGQGANGAPPLSAGEGLNSPSNYLQSGAPNDSLIVSFDTPVFGAGLFVIDSFNIAGTTTSIAAYDSSNTLLGTFAGANFNFQTNHRYFMGISSSSSDIASIVFTHLGGSTGDLIGVDDLMVASGNNVPDSGSAAALFGASLFGLLALRRRSVRP